ncbi:heme-dependent oxidative N-demethylase family protein [Enterovirga rhinocerotis]|uniref:Uncharacterized protein DUF3445 n=1 Tax=Enterovirga rhinocerotis TaxID=1339210 RepID=A0A4R7CCI3_9HYPH|nr:DUF3445 domain-containing protein [Enterovirga rhinocerotis]TDR94517.1 uncharacterized protein DUF3445 [Enterovirga rhinocerotis]
MTTRSVAPDIPFARGTMRMGLSPIDAAEWIQFGEDTAAQMAEKARLLATRRDDVLAALPGSEDAAAEVLELLRANLRLHHPGRLADAPEDVAEPPLARAARLVQEDVCILLPAEGGYRLVAGCVCFPSNWILREKLGHPLGEIHGPVPGYAPALAAPVGRFFERLAPGHIVARLNWLVHDNADLFQRGRTADAPAVTADNAGDVLRLRTERQVLQRLPRTGAVIFSIRTRLHRLRDAVPSPAKATELATALSAMPRELQAYRHMGPFLAPLLGWLDAMAGPPEAPPS